MTDITDSYRLQSASLNAKLRGYQNGSIKPAGILLFREALHQLETDTKPWNDSPSPQGACKGSFSSLCNMSRKIFPTTPVGSYVGVFRGILLLIDTMPILLKILFSLRGRRPYDVLVAALEETSVAASINGLDSVLNTHGGEMEDRAASRKARRRGSGARLIRESRRERARAVRAEVRSERQQDKAFARARNEKSQGFPSKARDLIKNWRHWIPRQEVPDERSTSNWREPRSYGDDI